MFHPRAGAWRQIRGRTRYSTKKSRAKAAFQQETNRSSGQSSNLALPPIGHVAHAREAKDHHRPGGWLGDSSDRGAGNAEIVKKKTARRRSLQRGRGAFLGSFDRMIDRASHGGRKAYGPSLRVDGEVDDCDREDTDRTRPATAAGDDPMRLIGSMRRGHVSVVSTWLAMLGKWFAGL